MNKVFKHRWSRHLGCLVVTCERSKGAQGKKGAARRGATGAASALIRREHKGTGPHLCSSIAAIFGAGHGRRRPALLATAPLLALMLNAGAAWGQAFIDGGPSVTVPGDRPNPWNVDGTLFVGASGTGTLTIGNGGTVRNTIGYIGYSSAGSVTVTGAGANWENSDRLYVGFLGTGTLTIADGGTVGNTDGYIGHSNDGTVIVTGAGAAWENSSRLYVGYFDTGTLTIADGGGVSASNLILGSLSGSSGTLTLTGTEGARGVLAIRKLEKGNGSATISLDGGILRASGNEADFLAGFDPGDVTIAAGGAFVDSNGYAIGIGAVLGGAGGLTKQGAGTLTLSGANTYTGATTVSAGHLAVNGSITSAVSVSNGGTLSGIGTVGSTTVASGGTLSPGNSIGMLTIAVTADVKLTP